LVVVVVVVVGRDACIFGFLGIYIHDLVPSLSLLKSKNAHESTCQVKHPYIFGHEGQPSLAPFCRPEF